MSEWQFKPKQDQIQCWMRLAALWMLVPLLAACAGGPTIEPQTRLSAVEVTGGSGAAGFARVTEPRPFTFPRDHGPHPEYAIEWWYYTGNLASESRAFGYQLTFFRYALDADVPERESEWGTADIYMAHFALTDIDGAQFYAFDRFSRGAAGLAGATGEPFFRVWLEDWSAEGEGTGLPMHLRAAEGAVAIDLRLDSERPVVLQGDRGYSQKGSDPGNASYYYSFTRLETEGVITIGDERFAVRGLSWMDHEFGTSALEEGTVGWDWFALQFDDGHDLMYAQVRDASGGASLAFGTLVLPDGSTQTLDPASITLDVLDTWRSPDSGVVYPSDWRLQIPDEGIDLRVTPALAAQELPLAVLYWEGAVRTEGTLRGRAVRGSGYVELTGYTEEEGAVRVR